MASIQVMPANSSGNLGPLTIQYRTQVTDGVFLGVERSSLHGPRASLGVESAAVRARTCVVRRATFLSQCAFWGWRLLPSPRVATPGSGSAAGEANTGRRRIGATCHEVHDPGL